MGTSSIYKGQNDSNSLLPDWLEDELDDSIEKKDKIERLNSWQNTKKLMSQFVTGSNKNIGGMTKAYVGAHGGSKRSAQTAIAGKSTAISLGTFIFEVNKNGFKETLNNYGIEYEDKSLLNVLSDLGNQISPSGALKEEDIARKALFLCLEDLFTVIEDESNEINDLDDLKRDHLEFVMENYLAKYVFERLLNDLEYSIEKYGNNAASIEKEIKDYVDGKIHNELSKYNLTQLDYNSSDIKIKVQEIFESCYKVLEVTL